MLNVLKSKISHISKRILLAVAIQQALPGAASAENGLRIKLSDRSSCKAFIFDTTRELNIEVKEDIREPTYGKGSLAIPGPENLKIGLLKASSMHVVLHFDESLKFNSFRVVFGRRPVVDIKSGGRRRRLDFRVAELGPSWSLQVIAVTKKTGGR